MIQPITKNNVAFKGSNPENVFSLKQKGSTVEMELRLRNQF